MLNVDKHFTNLELNYQILDDIIDNKKFKCLTKNNLQIFVILKNFIKILISDVYNFIIVDLRLAFF